MSCKSIIFGEKLVLLKLNLEIDNLWLLKELEIVKFVQHKSYLNVWRFLKIIYYKAIISKNFKNRENLESLNLEQKKKNC